EALKYGKQGEVHFGQKNFKESAKAFALAFKNDPTNLYYVKMLGYSVHVLGYHKEALEIYSGILRSTNDANVVYNIACIYSVNGMPNEAFAYLQKAIAMNSNYRNLAANDNDFFNLK